MKMKKLFLLALLFLVCFIGFNVKADESVVNAEEIQDDVVTTNENKDDDVVTEGKKEEDIVIQTNNDEVVSENKEEASNATSEIIMPSKTFTGSTSLVDVVVTVPEGVFPDGTIMKIEQVSKNTIKILPKKNLDKIHNNFIELINIILTDYTLYPNYIHFFNIQNIYRIYLYFSHIYLHNYLSINLLNHLQIRLRHQ